MHGFLDVTERRRRIRFSIALVARYAVPGGREIEGRTVNISGHSILTLIEVPGDRWCADVIRTPWLQRAVRRAVKCG
jgi:hypothetical protein